MTDRIYNRLGEWIVTEPTVNKVEMILPLELPSGVRVGVSLSAYASGEIEMVFENVPLADELIYWAARNELMSLGLHYSRVEKKEADLSTELSKRAKSFQDTRNGWTDGTKAFDSRFPTIKKFVEEFGLDALAPDEDLPQPGEMGTV